jgi:hypothetical protein
MPRRHRSRTKAQGQKTRAKAKSHVSTYTVPQRDKEKALTERDLRSIELIQLSLKGESHE